MLLELLSIDDEDITELDAREELEGSKGSELLDALEKSGRLDDDSILELLDNIGSEELLLDSTTLLATLLLASLDAEPLQIAPVTVGRCAGLLAVPLLPCTPNSMDCPGLIRLFQPTPVAV
jgi:hypothetical protein